MSRFKTVDLVMIALVAAILCILGPMSIPLGFTPIPVTLGIFGVLMAGILMGANRGALCVLVWILLGAAGLPVFSYYTGGLQKVIGPTGGYIMSSPFVAWLTGFFTERFSKSAKMTMVGAAIGSVCGILVCYAFGTFWYGMLAKLSVMEALWAAALPFLPMDGAKIIAAVAICCPIRRMLLAQGLLPRDL